MMTPFSGERFQDGWNSENGKKYIKLVKSCAVCYGLCLICG